MDCVKLFFDTYGMSLVALMLFGVLAGGFLEATVKKAYSSALKKASAEDTPKLEKRQSTVYTSFAFVFSFWFAYGVYVMMPLPCGVMGFPAWVFLVYVSQYVVSMYGIKGILTARANRKEKAKEPKLKDVLIPTGVKGVYKTEDGTLVDKHGNLVTL